MPPKPARPTGASTRYTPSGLPPAPGRAPSSPAAPVTPGDGRISAGFYPVQLILVCSELGVSPEDLIDWAVRRGEVALILPDGSKARRPIEGEWVRGLAPKYQGLG